MSNRLAVRACDILQAERTEELRAAIRGEHFTLLREDAEASAIARKLRGFSDTAIAWIEHLSTVNMDLICAVLDTTPHVLVLASKYEAARRKAFPNTCTAPRAGIAAGPRIAPSVRGSAVAHFKEAMS